MPSRTGLTFFKLEVLVTRMCDHGGTEVLNLSQNNLALVPEFPFSLVISKMREVYQITPQKTTNIIIVLVGFSFHHHHNLNQYPGEPDQRTP